MKKFITSLAMLLLLVFGCTDQTGITSPVQSEPSQTLKLIKLPAPKGLSIETLYVESKYISGYNGGEFTEQFSYQSGTGTVTINSQLVFPRYAFSGGKTVTQTFNTETASLEFGPAMQFNNPVKYTLTVTGLDLTGINPETLDFVYVAQDGSITGVVYDSLEMDAATKTIQVTNAQLNHFSRYGFVN